MSDPTPKQFVCTKGNYREFRGYVFAWGQPTWVRDMATLGILSDHPDYREYAEPKAERPTLRIPERKKRSVYV